MTIPPAHRKWLIVFGVSVVVWVGLAVATVVGKSSLEVRAFRSIFSVTLSGGAFYISSFEDKKLDPGFYASIEPEKHLIEPPPFHMALFIWPIAAISYLCCLVEPVYYIWGGGVYDTLIQVHGQPVYI